MIIQMGVSNMFTLKERLMFWFIRAFKTRNCIKSPNDWSFSWSDEEIPDWVKNTDKSKFEFKIEEK